MLKKKEAVPSDIKENYYLGNLDILSAVKMKWAKIKKKGFLK